MTTKTLDKRQVRFSNLNQADFFRTLRKRVDAYFTTNGLKKTANTHMVTKTIAMLAMYLIPFASLFLIPFTAWWQALFIWFFMGVGIAGVGFSIMHDAVHGAYSNNKFVNNLLSTTMYLLGGSVFTWKVKHNVMHHTYTNVHEMDEDIESRVIIRMCPHAPLYKIHRYQHIYSGLLYGLLTLFMIFSDFHKVFYYNKEGFNPSVKPNFVKEFIIMIVTKTLYFAVVLVLPMMVLPFLWWQTLLGFLVMHIASGYILSIVFQMAHVVEETDFPMPDENGNLENSWAIHQLRTTSDFARGNKLISWFVGGLNYQVEHHLFPNICHVYYPALSEIVESTAKEFGVPYHYHDTFGQAIASHYRTMRKFGRGEE